MMKYKDQRQGRRANIVLIADDDRYVRTLIRTSFSNLAEVIEAKNGDEILTLYQDYNPDMVLLDIHMPAKDGKIALREIRGIDEDAFVVMVSNDAVPENVRTTSLSGAKGFIAKPFSNDTLMKYAFRCPTLNFSDQQAV